MNGKEPDGGHWPSSTLGAAKLPVQYLGKSRMGRQAKALKRSDQPPAAVLAWCDGMLKDDRVGFIYREELDMLRSHTEASRS